MSPSGEHTYIELLRAYRSGKLVLNPRQKVIFEAILKGRKERVLRSKSELSEALFCTIIAANEDTEVELEWWKERKR